MVESKQSNPGCVDPATMQECNSLQLFSSWDYEPSGDYVLESNLASRFEVYFVSLSQHEHSLKLLVELNRHLLG